MQPEPIGYKNQARVFSSVVDASLKTACAADGVRKGPIFSAKFQRNFAVL